MKQIVGAFCTLFIFMLNLFMCMSVSTVSSSAAAAKEYKADIIAEIENSNFNPNVIAACKEQASKQGYTLEITSCLDDENNVSNISEVILSYSYELPLFGIKGTKTTRGIAR